MKKKAFVGRRGKKAEEEGHGKGARASVGEGKVRGEEYRMRENLILIHLKFMTFDRLFPPPPPPRRPLLPPTTD